MAIGMDDRLRRLTKDLEMIRFADQPSEEIVGGPVTNQGAPTYTPNITTEVAPSILRTFGRNAPENKVGKIFDRYGGKIIDNILGDSTDLRLKELQLRNEFINSQNAPETSVLIDKKGNFLGSTRDIRTILDAQNNEDIDVLSVADYKTRQANENTLNILGRDDIDPRGIQGDVQSLLGGDVLNRNNKILSERYQINDLGYFMPKIVENQQGRKVKQTPSSGFDLGFDSDISLKYIFQGDNKIFGSSLKDYTQGGRASSNKGEPNKRRIGLPSAISQFSEENFLGGFVPDALTNEKYSKYRTFLQTGYNELKGALAKDVGERSQVAGLDLVKETLPDLTNSIEFGVSNAKILLPALYNDFENLHKQMVTANKLGKAKPENWSVAQTEIYEALPKTITLTKLILSLARKEGIAVEEGFEVAPNKNQEVILKELLEKRFGNR